MSGFNSAGEKFRAPTIVWTLGSDRTLYANKTPILDLSLCAIAVEIGVSPELADMVARRIVRLLNGEEASTQE